MNKASNLKLLTFILTVLVIFTSVLPSAFANETPLESNSLPNGVLTVAEAIARNNDGSVATVQGVIVGYAISGTSIGTDPSGNNAQYNLVIKDTPDAEQKLILQLPTSLRPDWSIRLNPDVIGQTIQATGKLEVYFNVNGLKSVTSINPPPPAEQVTIMYDPNGARVSGAPLSYQVIKDSSYVVLSPAELGLTNSGMLFTGWKISETETVAAGSTITPSQNLTLVAQWMEEQVTISFDTSQYNGEVFAPVTLRKGYSFNTAKQAMPYPSNTEEQYFAYWYRLGPNGEEVYTNQATRFQEDTVLYPKYLDKKPLRFHLAVTLDRLRPLLYNIYQADGTLVAEDVPTGYDNAYVLLEEGNYYLTISHEQLRYNGYQYDSLVSYTRDNYDEPLKPTQTQNGDLSQGSFDEEGNFRLNFVIQAGPNNTASTISYHRTLAWLNFDATGPQQWIVTYDANGGEVTQGNQSVMVLAGSELTLPHGDELGFYYQRGMIFNKWLLEGSDPAVYYYAGDTITVDRDITLSAQWRRPGKGNADDKPGRPKQNP